jgi:2-polyprenyl-6-methoxyphenol hydroxylase-like FAD-dependent oxidoreductase
MTKVALVGAGQTGASAALALAQRGVEVTLYSDRPASSLRDGVPATGTALIFGEALAAEARLGLGGYSESAPTITGMTHRVTGADKVELIAFDGDFDGFTAEAVDARLKADDRIRTFRDLGGDFLVATIDEDALDRLAGAHDLTLVATGKGGLSSLFPRDPSRSVFGGPQRNVVMLTVQGLDYEPSVFAHRSPHGGKHAAFSYNAENGETWWGPYLHKDAGPVWSFLWWARPDSDWAKRQVRATDAESTLAAVRQLCRDDMPWDLPEVLEFRTIPEDPFAWQKGAVTPIVRAGLGYTKSGRPVASLGDTSIAFDPIAGQGAQGGLIQSALYIDRILEHEGAFDAAWIKESFEQYYDHRGAAAEKVTRLFLGHPETDAIAQILVSAANGSARFAGALFGLLSQPKALLSVTTEEEAKAFVTELSGEAAETVLSRSAERIEKATTLQAAGGTYFRRSGYGQKATVS